MTIKVEARQWKAPNRLDVPAGAQAHLNGFVPKWVTKHNLATRIAEGWDPIPRHGEGVKVKGDAVDMDNCYHVRELILCRMPKHMVDQRNEYYAAKNARAIGAIRRGTKMKQETAKANKEANTLRGHQGEGFVAGTGKVSISSPHGKPVKLEPMLDEKEVEEDLRSLGE